MSEPKRYTDLQVWEALHFAGSTNGWIRWEDYARLNAEVERLTEIIRREVDGGVDLREEAQRTVEENHNLRAEVERLKGIILAQSSDFVRSKTSDDGIKPEGHNDLAGRAVERCLELQAEVERLRKAGDELLHEWSSGDETDGRNFKKGLVLWNAAKEGKQS